MFVVEYTVGGGTKLAAFTVFAKGMEAISGIKLGSEVLVKFGVESLTKRPPDKGGLR